MDLTKVTTVRKSSIQSQNFDLRYKSSNGKFQLSDRFYANKGMNTNGLTFHLLEDNGNTIPLLSIRPNEESVFYKGKAGDAEKSTDFAYSILEASLQDLGLITNSGKFENFSLEAVGQQDGYTFYQVVPYTTDTETAPTRELTTNATAEAQAEELEEGEEVAGPSPTALEPVEVEEADEEYDPFA
jgi:hypothetical protein